ncbi:hypothetical protein E2C01_021254 [Portunus trituberculatus]|uniref:Transmembrane protein n=1 Tax=Portunus trituberculatus TaxID=210409 RepID=A0A5B7E209_PORTR|nr:hypothetical protein [Portunus trituberculatus]
MYCRRSFQTTTTTTSFHYHKATGYRELESTELPYPSLSHAPRDARKLTKKKKNWFRYTVLAMVVVVVVMAARHGVLPSHRTRR